MANIKAFGGLAWTGLKSVNALAKASVKALGGLTAGASVAVTKIGSQQTGTGQTSVAITTTDAASSGGIVIMVMGNTNTEPTSATCVDGDTTLTWTLLQSAYATVNGVAMAVFHAPVTSPLASGKTITISNLPSTRWQAYVYRCTPGALDVSAQKTSNSSTSHVTGQTAAIAGAGEVALYMFGVVAGTITDTFGGATLDGPLSMSSRVFQTFWKAVDSGTQQGTATISGSTAGAGLIVVLKP
jgi:hypothetical protein